MAETAEQRLAMAIEERLMQMPRAKRIAKFRELSASSPADVARMRAIFPDLYREAFPSSPAAGGQTESSPHVGLYAKPR